MGIWLEQRACPGRADSPPRLRLLVEWLERTIDGGGTHASDTRLHRNGELA
jgi:hypothetical protein